MCINKLIKLNAIKLESIGEFNQTQSENTSSKDYLYYRITLDPKLIEVVYLKRFSIFWINRYSSTYCPRIYIEQAI